MIKCKMYQDEQERISFEAEITGVEEDVLIELMKINGMLIRNFREKGLPDELIEKQLVNCIVAGFEIDKFT